MKILHSLSLLVVLSPAAALAGGIALSEASSQSSGRGYAAAALHDSPSVIFYNPANITRLKGVQLDLGATLLMPRWSYAPQGGGQKATSDASVSTPPALSASYNLGNVGFGDLAAGVGFYTVAGAAFSWPDNWTGRDEVQQLSLQVFELNPVLALRPESHVAFGVGFRYLPGAVYLKRAARFGSTDEGEVELGGSGSGIGMNAGVSIWPLDGLAIGLSWRSASTIDFGGKSNFTFAPPFDTEANDGTVSTSIPLAQMWRVGVAYDVMKDLNVSADFEYQQWDTFKSLDITLKDKNGSQTAKSARDSKNSIVLHLGGEYELNETVALRAGYVYDQRTLPAGTVNPAPPDSDRHVVTVGATYRMAPFAVHLHAGDVFFSKRITSSNAMPGEWSGGWAGGTMAYIFGLSVSAALDAFSDAASVPAETGTL